jgi:hypothetical protein
VRIQKHRSALNITDQEDSDRKHKGRESFNPSNRAKAKSLNSSSSSEKSTNGIDVSSSGVSSRLMRTPGASDSRLLSSSFLGSSFSLNSGSSSAIVDYKNPDSHKAGSDSVVEVVEVQAHVGVLPSPIKEESEVSGSESRKSSSTREKSSPLHRLEDGVAAPSPSARRRSPRKLANI